MIRIHAWALASAALLFAVSVPTAAQSSQFLDETYHYGVVLSEPGAGCAPGTEYAYGEYGEVTLKLDGSFVLQATENEVCSTGGSFTAPIFEVGVYSLTEDGSLTLDFNPLVPGTDILPLQLSWDGEVAIASAGDPSEPGILIGIRESAGESAATLAGDYALLNFFIEDSPGGFGVLSMFGAVNFDGVGNFTVTGQEHELFPGQVPFDGVFSDGSTYGVFPNGEAWMDTATPVGAVTSDGRIGFLMIDHGLPGSVPDIAIFVRKGTSPVTPQAFEDGWWMSTLGGTQAPALGTLSMSASHGLVTADPVLGNFSYTGGVGGNFTLASSGAMTLTWPTAVPESAWIAGSEDFAIFANLTDPTYAGIGVLLRDWSPLQKNVETVSLSSGGAQVLELRATNDYASRWYVTLGSASGTSPGTVFGGGVLPLNIDSYTLLSVSNANTVPFINTAGLLSADGKATAGFVIPPGLSPGLAGVTLHHAAVVLDVSSPQPFLTATNAASVTFVP